MDSVHVVMQNDSVLAVHHTFDQAVAACESFVKLHTTYTWQQHGDKTRWYGRSNQLGDFPISLRIDKWEVKS